MLSKEILNSLKDKGFKKHLKTVYYKIYFKYYACFITFTKSNRDSNLVRINFSIKPLFINFFTLTKDITLKPGGDQSYFTNGSDWIPLQDEKLILELLQFYDEWFETNSKIQNLIAIVKENRKLRTISDDWRYYELCVLNLFNNDIGEGIKYFELLKNDDNLLPFMKKFVEEFDIEAIDSTYFEENYKINVEALKLEIN